MSRTLTFAGGKLVAAQDQDELGAYLIGLLKLGLERTALIVGLGHDACGAKLLRNGKDVLAQLLTGVGDIDARASSAPRSLPKACRASRARSKPTAKPTPAVGLPPSSSTRAVVAAAATDGADAGAGGLDLKDSTGVVVRGRAPGWDPRHTRYRRHPDSA